jgi:hypothetical protein
MLTVTVIALAVGMASYAVVKLDPWAVGGSGLPETFEFDIGDLMHTDPGLIRFQESAAFSVSLDQVRAIAVGPDQRIYVAGDSAVHSFLPSGRQLAVIPVADEPTCLAVGGSGHVAPGRIYVGVERRIQLFDPSGKPAGRWDGLDDNAMLTSIAVSNDDVFVADAGNRVVLRFDSTGKLLGRIGAASRDREMPGFIVPGPYFDVAVQQDLVHVANPGARRIETYSFDGVLETLWGRSSPAIGDFFGCCNPVQFALLPSGEFLTSEKGIPRIKIYSDAGEFECLVAGPEQLQVAQAVFENPQFAEVPTVFDVAADELGRVLILDPRTRSVRIFTRLNTTTGAE